MSRAVLLQIVVITSLVAAMFVSGCAKPKPVDPAQEPQAPAGEMNMPADASSQVGTEAGEGGADATPAAGGETAGDATVGEIEWIRDLKEGLAKAKAEKKVAMIDFYSETCPPCKQMEKQVWPHPKVVKAAENLVCIQLNVADNVDLAKEYKVEFVPFFVFVGPNGKRVKDHVGMLGAVAMAKLMEETAK